MHFFSFFPKKIWSCQKKAVPLHPLSRNRVSRSSNGAPDANQRSVCGGESGGLEDFNESVALAEDSVSVRKCRTRGGIAQLVRAHDS